MVNKPLQSLFVKALPGRSSSISKLSSLDFVYFADASISYNTPTGDGWRQKGVCFDVHWHIFWKEVSSSSSLMRSTKRTRTWHNHVVLTRSGHIEIHELIGVHKTSWQKNLVCSAVVAGRPGDGAAAIVQILPFYCHFWSAHSGVSLSELLVNVGRIKCHTGRQQIFMLWNAK